jgi:hypothetical protein
MVCLVAFLQYNSTQAYQLSRKAAVGTAPVCGKGLKQCGTVDLLAHAAHFVDWGHCGVHSADAIPICLAHTRHFTSLGGCRRAVMICLHLGAALAYFGGRTASWLCVSVGFTWGSWDVLGVVAVAGAH